MIDLQELAKSYGNVRALRGISTHINRGEVVGLLGPNGAGKTTAMKILAGYILPSSGAALISGFDVTADPIAVQRRIGYLPENAPLYTDMLVQEYLQFMADMRDLERAAARTRIGQAAEQCDVRHVLGRPIGQLSKGYRQRVGLAATLLHDPEILILDEPTTGLDPNQIVEIRDLIRRMGETKTVILSTHILSEVEATCSRAVILIDGQIRADGTLDELTRSTDQVVSLAADDNEQAAVALRSLRGVEQVMPQDWEGDFQTFRLRLTEGAEIGESVFDLVRDRGWRLRELRRDDRTLEQVFRELTESAERAA